MFEIGFWELVLIGVVALIVVGPERLPGLARTAGLWLGKARRMIADVKAEVDRELQLDDIKQTLRQQAHLGEVQDLTDRMKSLRDDIQAEFDDPGPPPGWRPGIPAGATPSDPDPSEVEGSAPSAASSPTQQADAERKRPGPPPAAPMPPPRFPSPPPSDRGS